jgi:O-antigen/teichoic acid export membrane protein
LLLLVAVALVVSAMIAILSTMNSDLVEPAAIGFIPAFLLYQYVRAFAFSRKNVSLAAVLTGSVLVLCAAGLGLDQLAGAAADAGRVLTIVGAAYGICSVGVLLVLLGGMTPMVRPSEWRPYRRYLHSSGWMMLGAASGEAISRVYSFVVVARFGTEALARLSAVQVAIRPAWLLSAAWGSVGFPTMSGQRAANDRRGLMMTMLRGATLTCLGSLVWSALVIATWPEIAGILYRGRYLDATGIAYLWAGNVLLGSTAYALNIAMLALGEFRRLALLDLVSAGFSLACLTLLGRFDYPFAIVATMVGQVSQIVLMGYVLSTRLRSSAPIAVL